MKHLFAVGLVGVLLAGAGIVGAQGTSQAEKLFEAARRKEVVEGDLRAAIARYADIVTQFKSQPAVAARALYQLAQCQEKLGQADAKRSYERIVREFPAAGEYATAARARLSALAAPESPRSDGPSSRRIWADAADVMGSVSADGRYLSYTDWDTGDLAIRDLAAGTNRRLTNTGGWDASGDYAETSRVSPDGSFVAYAWYVNKTRKYDLRLASVSNAAAKPRVLLTDLSWGVPHDWTRDGKSVVFGGSVTRGTHELGILSLADGSRRILTSFTPSRTSPRRVSVSPDGAHITYALDTGEDLDVWIMPIKGGGATRVVSGPTIDRDPFWSPDGSRLLFVSTRTGRPALWALRMDGARPVGTAEMVADAVDNPFALTRTGTLLYFRGGAVQNIYMAEIDEAMKITSPPELVTGGFLNANVGATWSPDGRHIAYYASRLPDQSAQATAVVIRTVATGAERQLFVNVDIASKRPNVTHPRWFPDGKSLLVVAHEKDPRALASAPEGARGVLAYHRVDINTGAAELIRHTSAAGLAFGQVGIAPDGKALYHMVRETDPSSFRLVQYDIGSRQETELIKTWAGSVAVSPDGLLVAYLGGPTANSGSSHVGVVPAKGGTHRILVENTPLAGRFGVIGWSADSRFVLFVKRNTPGGSPVVWRVPAAGGTAEPTGVSAPNGSLYGPNMHPDGRRILYSLNESKPLDIWVLENFLPKRSGS